MASVHWRIGESTVRWFRRDLCSRLPDVGEATMIRPSVDRPLFEVYAATGRGVVEDLGLELGVHRAVASSLE